MVLAKVLIRFCRSSREDSHARYPMCCLRAFPLLAIVFALYACAVSSGHVASPVASSPIGVWEVSESWGTARDGNAWHFATPQPLLIMFTRQHYVEIGRHADTLARPFSTPPTDDERLAYYRQFVANAGTYSVSGDTIICQPEVGAMANGTTPIPTRAFRYRFRLLGDTLFLNQTNQRDGSTLSLRLSRRE